jgi:hypothetical protein
LISSLIISVLVFGVSIILHSLQYTDIIRDEINNQNNVTRPKKGWEFTLGGLLYKVTFADVQRGIFHAKQVFK